MTGPGALGALGWLGALALLLGYVQVSRGRQAGDGAAFATLNVIGSAGLGLAAAGGRVWSSAALNATWVLIGVVTLVRVNRRQRSRGTGRRPAEGWRRHLVLLLDGFRAEGAHPLPEPPLPAGRGHTLTESGERP